MIEREVMELRSRVGHLERTLALLAAQLGIQLPAEIPITGVPPRVVSLVRAGDKIGAIKAYREETGADLAEAKRIIDGMG